MRRRALWLAAGGVALLASALVGDSTLPRHMVEHGLLSGIAPPLLLLGRPLTLLLRALPRDRRLQLLALLRGRLGLLAHPAIAWPLFVGVQWAFHVGPLPAIAERNAALHVAEHGLMLATGLLFWAQVVGRLPLRHRLGGAARSLYLLFAMPGVDLVAVWYLATGREAAGIAMLASMLTLQLGWVLVVWTWISREERRAARWEAYNDATA